MEETKKEKAYTKYVHIALYVLVILLSAGVVFAYAFGPQNSFARGVARVLHLPAAFVGGSAISLDSYYDRLYLATKVPGQERISRKAVLSKMIEDRVAGEGITVSAADLDQAYEQVVKITGTENPEQRYGLTKEEFKNQILHSDVIHTKRALALANDKGYNAEAHRKFSQAQSKLNSGTQFAEVVEEYSDDGLSAQIGGDIGFVSQKDLVPEYFTEVQKVQDRATHTVTTRHGLYLFQVLGKDQSGDGGATRYHVRHIFIKAKDYQQWLGGRVSEKNIFKFV